MAGSKALGTGGSLIGKGDSMRPEVDIVVLSAGEGPLDARVERGIAAQTEVRTRLHRVVAAPRPGDRHRRETIARGRNEGLERGRAPWLLFLDDDVELQPGCLAGLLAGLARRPIYGALAADYLGESVRGAIAPHVGMGATLLRRAALGNLRFRWTRELCECQCLCDDLRARRWAIDYWPGARARHFAKGPSAACQAGGKHAAPAGPPIVLAAFDERHMSLFRERFLASLRAAGNWEQVVAVTYGLRTRHVRTLAREPNVRVVEHALGDESVPRQRLRDFSGFAGRLPSATPLAFWDAGDVRFQAPLGGLWNLVRTYPDRLLAVQEPFRHPENPIVARWTLSIADPQARRTAFDLLKSRPCLNGGFAAGTAEALARYGHAAYALLRSRALRGSTDWGDQTALNLYCHRDPQLWQEIDEGWNYCLCGRPRGEAYWEDDGRIASRRGTPIHVAHGNAQSLLWLRGAAGF